MSRPLRIEYEGAFYHVTARSNERRNIFFAESDYEKLKAYLKEAIKDRRLPKIINHFNGKMSYVKT
jgi:REP element-mobilizing transposase RayT